MFEDSTFIYEKVVFRNLDNDITHGLIVSFDNKAFDKNSGRLSLIIIFVL